MKLTSHTWLLAIPLAVACRTTGTVIDVPTTPTATPVFNGVAIAADVPPPPISGATVRIINTKAGAYAVASDPDEDSVHIVSLGASADASPTLVGTIALERGDEPNRIVGDSQGRAHVVLRGGGAIATIDLATASLVARRSVCPAPRGIDYDTLSDTLYVACATGELVTLPSLGVPTRTTRLDLDLRDVVVDRGTVYVSRFKSAELLHVASDGTLATRTKQSMPTTLSTSMESVVAWRTVRNPSGGALMLHQLASNEALVVVPQNTYYAETGGPIVLSVLSSSSTGTTDLLQVNPAIDVTFDATGNPEALSIDGAVDFGSYQTIYLNGSAYTGGVLANNAEFTGIDDGSALGVPWVVVHRRAPTSVLLVYPPFPAASSITYGTTVAPQFTVPLSGTSHVDTGFDIFHLPTSVGTACMSCHPEGGDDGHAWKFSYKDKAGTVFETRLRRTQTLLGGTSTNTAPYHWDGDLENLQILCDEVFTHRMGGGRVTPAQAPILARWLDSIPSAPARTDLDPTHVASGQAIFNGSAGCNTCHDGGGHARAIKDIGKTDALGSTKALQVPSLAGVGYRAPYMHDGCAATLMDRLTNPACAGANHGNTSSLGTSDLQDLETYLQSL